jgi:phosphotransferase system HPr (HPr) family protein
MRESTLEVLNEEGLHTRPAHEFVKSVKQFESTVTLQKGDTEVPGKSLLKIMKLGVVTGDTITLRCDGPDEDAALAALVQLIQPGSGT